MGNDFDMELIKASKIWENKICKIVRMIHFKHANNDIFVGHLIKEVNPKIEIL